MPLMTVAEFEALRARHRARGHELVSDDQKPSSVDPRPQRIEKAVVSVREPKRVEKQNKTERAWHEILLRRGFVHVGVQEITLRIADNCRYTPDHWTMSTDGTVTFWEVKGGFIREDSTIKLKTAAARFPMFRFVRAQKSKGQWTETEILP